LYFDDAIDAALGHHDVSVMIRHHVAHSPAARWDGPSLEFLASGIEPYERIWPYSRLAIPHRSFGEGNTIGLRLRPAGRGVFLHVASVRIETTKITARIVRIPDNIIRRDREAT
jgi:hypothetical protein